MTLIIQELRWGIDRKNGGSIQRLTAEEYFPCVVGALPPFALGRRQFTIDEVGESTLTLSVHYPQNPAADRQWTLCVGEEQGYCPRSFDGGYKYRFKLI